MAKDIPDRIGQILGSDSARQLANIALDEAFKAVGERRSGSSRGGGMMDLAKKIPGSAGKIPGARGLAAGAGAAALAPVAFKGLGKVIKGNGVGNLAEAPKNLAQGAAAKVGDSVGDKVSSKIDEAGGPSGILKDTVKKALPFGGDGGTKNHTQGAGKGRRMPVQQSVDVAVPLETAYNQWTQFEEWPKFMHRVTRVTQEDPCTASFTAKIWGKTKEFKAKIETQRPDERIKWKVDEGITHTGVVTFHELAPRLTRIELDLDVEPGSLLEKAARGMRHIKRAARGDLHRFKAFIEVLENETGAWRGEIDDGELVKDHNAGYDRKREYSSTDELLPDADGSSRAAAGRSSQGRTSRSPSRSSRGSSSNGGSPSRTKASSSGRKSGSGSSRSGSKSRSGSGSSRSSSGSSRSSGSSSSRKSSGSSGGSSQSASSRSSGRTRSRAGSSGSGPRSASRGSANHQGRQRSRSSGNN
jgi:uncharacterized membrane protein